MKVQLQLKHAILDCYPSNDEDQLCLELEKISFSEALRFALDFINAWDVPIVIVIVNIPHSKYKHPKYNQPEVYLFNSSSDEFKSFLANALEKEVVINIYDPSSKGGGSFDLSEMENITTNFSFMATAWGQHETLLAGMGRDTGSLFRGN